MAAAWGREPGVLALAEGRFEVKGVVLSEGRNRIQVLAEDAAGNEGFAVLEVVWSGAAQPVSLKVEAVEGSLQLRMAGAPGKKLRIERTHDLLSWAAAGEVVLNEAGAGESLQAVRESCAFFRLAE